MGTRKVVSFTVEAILRYREVESVVSRESLDNMRYVVVRCVFFCGLECQKVRDRSASKDYLGAGLSRMSGGVSSTS